MQVEEEIIAGYKQSILGIIPQDWEVVELRDIGNVLNGLTYKPTDICDKGLLVLRSSNISHGRLSFNDNVYVQRSVKFNPVKLSDILICVRNGSRNLIGKNALITKDAEGFAFGAFMTIYRSKENLFLYHYFNSNLFANEIIKNLGATINSINNGDLKRFKVPLPRIDERKKIADCLSAWDNAIEQLSALIDKKELQKRALMQQLLTGKKRLKGFSGKWKEYHLGELFKERNETGNLNLQLLSIGQNGVYPQSESPKKDTSNEDKSKYKKIRVGDIGYNTMRMWQGRSALSGLEGIVSPAYTIVTPKDTAHSQFFAYLFKTPKATNLFWRNSQGLVDDTLNCKYKDFAIVKFILPEKGEQTAIAAVLQQADKEIVLLRTKLDKLKQQKKGLMQVLLTGKKRLKFN